MVHKRMRACERKRVSAPDSLVAHCILTDRWLIFPSDHNDASMLHQSQTSSRRTQDFFDPQHQSVKSPEFSPSWGIVLFPKLKQPEGLFGFLGMLPSPR